MFQIDPLGYGLTFNGAIFIKTIFWPWQIIILFFILSVKLLDVYPYYISKLSSFRRKSKRPIVSMPSSFRRGMIWSFTMITFLKESLMFVSERDSCIFYDAKITLFILLHKFYIKKLPILTFFLMYKQME